MPVKKSSASRVAAWRQRKAAEGLVQVTVMVPRRVVADVRKLAERLEADPDLTVGPVRRVSSGKLERL